ncbi:DUF2911 domain-containing protein [Lacinutrix sp. C3R15]|uniref:DUF2911 domain-containing protein n=1 Tax=Flavobacteriaceae TaxID=49546 RepID=UPI001C0A58D7|nr:MULTISPECIES: DUF2911 domain-containing protein [Flavobacteriaceae]MBU2939543.1 DUF2911 domain-containing protein [Lacinutrix sp. C3R15]MDO6622857.1 DUF2911 domain-containing protein [Oceanihabitans sp. 1_MG-2023]
MKIHLLYYTLFVLCTTAVSRAQEQTVTNITIQKIGETELKTSINLPKKQTLNHNKGLKNYKNQWKQNANGKTVIEFNNDILVNNIKLKAGKYYILFFPGNDWQPNKDSIAAFPGNDWKPKNNSLIRFPGNDWNPKNSKLKFPGNDWKPRENSIKFPGNDWKPVNKLMESFPGNDWLVVFYRITNSNKLDKNLIAAELTVDSKKLILPTKNLTANFIYLAPNHIELTLSLDKTLISIPIHIR